MSDYIAPVPSWLLVLLSLASIGATLLVWFSLSSQLATMRTSLTTLDKRVRAVETNPPSGSSADLAKRVAAVETSVDRLTNTVADNYTQLSSTVNQQARQIDDIRGIINGTGGGSGGEPGAGGDTGLAIKALRQDVTVLQNTVSTLGVTVNDHKATLPRLQQTQSDMQSTLNAVRTDVDAASRSARQANVGVETVSMNLDTLTVDQRDTAKRLSNAQTKYDTAITYIDDYHNARICYAPQGMDTLSLPDQMIPIDSLVSKLISSPLFRLYDILVLKGMKTEAVSNDVLHGALTYSVPLAGDGTMFLVVVVSPQLSDKYLFEFTRSNEAPTKGVLRLHVQSIGFDMHVVFDDGQSADVDIGLLLNTSVGAFALVIVQDQYTESDQQAMLQQLESVNKAGHLPPFVYRPPDTIHHFAFLMFWDDYTRYGRAYSARSVLPLLGNPTVSDIWGIDYQLTAQFRPLR